MSALRNKLNHGGSLLGALTSGGYWSLYWDKEKTKEVGIVIRETDQRFSVLDHKITKKQVEQIIEKEEHFDPVKEKMPDEIYIRQAIRIYIDLLSLAHAQIRLNSEKRINKSVNLIKEYFSKVDDDFAYAVLLKYDKGKLKEEMELFVSEKTLEGMQKENKAPLHIEYYAGMPGEHRDLPVLDEPIQKRENY